MAGQAPSDHLGSPFGANRHNDESITEESGRLIAQRLRSSRSSRVSLSNAPPMPARAAIPPRETGR